MTLRPIEERTEEDGQPKRRRDGQSEWPGHLAGDHLQLSGAFESLLRGRTAQAAAFLEGDEQGQGFEGLES